MELTIHANTVMENLEKDPNWLAPAQMNNVFINALNELRQKGYISYGEFELHQDIPQNSIINRGLIVILKSLDD
jgi:hypothetical protein